MEKRLNTGINAVKSLGVSTIFAMGIGVTYYGVTLIFMLFGAWFVLAFMVDVPLGWYVAKIHHTASSSIGRNGAISKAVNFIVLGLIVSIAGHISYLANSEFIVACASLACMIIILYFMYNEIVSIIENNIIISPEGKNKKALQFIAKIFGVTEAIAFQKLEKKLESIRPLQNNPPAP